MVIQPFACSGVGGQWQHASSLSCFTHSHNHSASVSMYRNLFNPRESFQLPGLLHYPILSTADRSIEPDDQKKKKQSQRNPPRSSGIISARPSETVTISNPLLQEVPLSACSPLVRMLVPLPYPSRGGSDRILHHDSDLLDDVNHLVHGAIAREDLRAEALVGLQIH